jgi:hypothetical protein
MSQISTDVGLYLLVQLTYNKGLVAAIQTCILKGTLTDKGWLNPSSF